MNPWLQGFWWARTLLISAETLDRFTGLSKVDGSPGKKWWE
jgi:hypothetical protein